MAKVWVHIEPTVTGNGQGAKTALTKTLTDSIAKSLAERVGKALPAETFTTDKNDKPGASQDAYNAIKITPGLTLKIDTKGSRLTVDSDLKMVFEAVRIPNLKNGNLLASAGKGVVIERRGSVEKDTTKFVEEAFDNIVAPAVKQVISQPRFKTYGKSLGLPFD
jgi:hypothetical protein